MLHPLPSLLNKHVHVLCRKKHMVGDKNIFFLSKKPLLSTYIYIYTHILLFLYTDLYEKMAMMIPSSQLTMMKSDQFGSLLETSGLCRHGVRATWWCHRCQCRDFGHEGGVQTSAPGKWWGVGEGKVPIRRTFQVPFLCVTQVYFLLHLLMSFKKTCITCNLYNLSSENHYS